MRSVNDEIVCPVCGKSFIFKGGRRKYCSLCAAERRSWNESGLEAEQK